MILHKPYFVSFLNHDDNIFWWEDYYIDMRKNLPIAFIKNNNADIVTNKSLCRILLMKKVLNRTWKYL